MARAGNFRAASASFAAAALVCLVSLSPLLKAPLLFDDHAVIEGDEAVVFADGDTTAHVDFFKDIAVCPRPVRQLTHRIDAALFGKGTTGPHAVNILLHISTGLAGCILLLSLGKPPWLASCAALLFLLNPVCVESVGIVSHRKELLSALFVTLALLAALKKSGGFSLVAAALAAVAVGAKETAVVFPLLFAAVAVRRVPSPVEIGRAGKSGKSVSRVLATYCALALALALAARFQIARSMEAHGGNPAADAFRAGHFAMGSSFSSALGAALRAFPRYIACMAWPLGHAIDPRFDLKTPLFSIACLAGVACVCLVATALVRSWRDRSAFFSPLAWCIAALAPYLWPPLLKAGATQILADRYAYLASFGAAWLAAEAVYAIKNLPLRRAVALAIAATFACSSFSLAKSYKSSTALWERTIRINPASFQAAHNYALALWREGGDAKAADAEFARMMRLAPDFDYGIATRAQTMAESGSPVKALHFLTAELAKKPDSVSILRQRGIVNFGLGRMESAVSDFSKAEALGAGDLFFREEYAEALLRTARWPEARKQFLLSARISDAPETRKMASMSVLLSANPPPRPGKLLVAGDSVPHGTRAVGPDGKEHGIAELLGSGRGFPFAGVRDISKPGSTAEELAAAAGRIMKASNAQNDVAAAVLIWTGHNDAFFGKSPQRILESVSKVALEVRKAGARPVLLGPIPVRNAPERDRTEQERTLAALNGIMRRFAKESGMEFVDVRAALKRRFQDPSEALDPDTGNHLTPAAMRCVADSLGATLLKTATR
ncbi:MAG: hypothetical protein IJS46_02410 [Kiritimatiellae bacterium]|nr:hypothetical protein [Kiritimatiellia bacterium]